MKEPSLVSKYEPAHKAKVAALQTTLWSSDVRLNTAYLEWKYERNPYLSEIPIYLAWREGELVGMRGFCGSLWEAGSPRQEYPIYCADDLAVSPEHRNRGVFTDIMRAALDDLARGRDGYTLTLSGGQMTMLGSLTMGWKSIGRTESVGLESSRAEREDRIRATVRTMPYFWRYAGIHNIPLVGVRPSFTRLDANAPDAPGADVIWLGRQPQAEAMATLIEELGTDGRIRHVRDATYLAWRFGNPLHEYRFLYSGNPTLDGYLVLRRCISDLADTTRVHISDWEARDVRIKERLLRAAIQWGAFDRLVTWSATLDDEQRGLLRDAGFTGKNVDFPARGYPCVLVRPLRAGTSDREWTIAGRHLLDISNWSLRMLYSMHG